MPIDRSRAPGIVLVAVALVMLFLLVAEHRAHGWWVWLLLLVCPVLLYYAAGRGDSGSPQEGPRKEDG